GSALRSAIFQRYCQNLAKRFDLMISAYNPMSFSGEGMQYVSDLSFDQSLAERLYRRSSDAGRRRSGKEIFNKIYRSLCDGIAGIDRIRWRENCTLTNSQWSAAVLKETFGVSSRVISPPVAEVAYSITKWQDREDGFVCLARFVPEKGLREVIGILIRVREKGHCVHLHIAGRRSDRRYTRMLARLAEEHHSWITLEPEMIGQERLSLLRSHKFGISGCRYEAFGIAVAEMCKSGCIVWVPHEGGQNEIVSHPQLSYCDNEDAVHKITEVLQDTKKQDQLRGHLEKQSERFSLTHFVGEFKDTVTTFLAGK
ncbi:MAG: glycosyltransferase family 4 protein, partial [Candidatus Omnitrophica bacterium]|nr:glycosyltransferase family 4 protein [Candidatus Omnitrophota bacterium]